MSFDAVKRQCAREVFHNRFFQASHYLGFKDAWANRRAYLKEAEAYAEQYAQAYCLPYAF